MVVVVDFLVVDELFVVEGVVVALSAGSVRFDSDTGGSQFKHKGVNILLRLRNTPYHTPYHKG